MKCPQWISQISLSLSPKYFPRHARQIRRSLQKVWTQGIQVHRPSRTPELGNRKPFLLFKEQLTLEERLSLVDTIERGLIEYASEAALRMDSPWRGNEFLFNAHLGKIHDHAAWEREHLEWEFAEDSNRGTNKPDLPPFRPLNPLPGDSNSLALLNHMLTFVELKSASEINYHQLTEYIDRDQKDLDTLSRSQPEQVLNKTWKRGKSVGMWLGATFGLGTMVWIISTGAQSFLSGQVSLQAEKGDAWSYSAKMWEMQKMGAWLTTYDPTRDFEDYEGIENRMRQLAIARRGLWLESVREARNDILYLDSVISSQELALDLAVRHQDQRRIWLIVSRLEMLRTFFIEVVNHPDFEPSNERLSLILEDYDASHEIRNALKSKTFMEVYRHKFGDGRDQIYRRRGDPFRND